MRASYAALMTDPKTPIPQPVDPAEDLTPVERPVPDRPVAPHSDDLTPPVEIDPRLIEQTK